MDFIDRLKHGWNAFMSRDPTKRYLDYGPSYSNRPDRTIIVRRNERSIITAMFNRMAMDAASITIQHCRLDDQGRYNETIDSSLNDRLTLEANKDQTARSFIQDAVMSMLDEGCIAICPIDTDTDIDASGNFKIESLRVGKIMQWYPDHIRVQCYNDRTGRREELTFAKQHVAIVENPFYAVVNEPNSTIQRLIRKLSLLDVTDEQTASGKLNLIIQLPYVVKSPAKEEQAEKRRRELEKQLTNSRYGIAYADGTEKIVQLNRELDNNLMSQIEYFTNLAFSQLGLTQSILDGTADDRTLMNYFSRTIEPLVAAIVDEMKRKFLTKTARTKKQSILYFRDPFKLVPLDSIAEIADKFTRNEIMTSNEIRQTVGMKPSSDPKADMLINSNIALSKEEESVLIDERYGKGENQNGLQEPESEPKPEPGL